MVKGIRHVEERLNAMEFMNSARESSIVFVNKKMSNCSSMDPSRRNWMVSHLHQDHSDHFPQFRW
jgi:hypothetical protein